MYLGTLQISLAVVLGKTTIPVEQLLQLSRGAVLPLDALPDDDVDILADGHPIARGRVQVSAGRITIEVTELATKPAVTRDPGTAIGGAAWQRPPAGKAGPEAVPQPGL